MTINAEQYQDLMTAFHSGLKLYMEFHIHSPTHFVVNDVTAKKMMEFLVKPKPFEDQDYQKMIEEGGKFMGLEMIITKVIQENRFYFLRDA